MKILVADDHDLVRDMIASFLEATNEFEVTLAADFDEALDIAKDQGDFEVILLDYNMPGMNGLNGLTKMLEECPDCPVAIISGDASPDIARKAFELGAGGFVPKTLHAKSMITAIQFIGAGEIYSPFEFMNQESAKDRALTILTERETEVLNGICAAKSNKEIAIDLKLHEVTVKMHVKTLCKKLEARNRTHAAMIARDRALV